MADGTGVPPIAGVRVARPTDRLAEATAFYVEALGLPLLGGFDDHDGYTGVFIGLPGEDVHLELTSHVDASPCPAPTTDNLLVLYLPDRPAVDAVAARAAAHGHGPVEPENPYWRGRSVTLQDPDGWRVVVVDSSA